MTRRKFRIGRRGLPPGALAIPALLRTAHAESFPSRLVRLAVSCPPGGAVDIAARLVGASGARIV